MFGSKRPSETRIELPGDSRKILDMEHAHELTIARLKQEHELALKEKEFELRHFKDDEILKLKDDLAKANQNIAVLKKENAMLDKIVDLNGDIIDVKDLVSKLIEKLPNIDLKSLTVNSSKD